VTRTLATLLLSAFAGCKSPGTSPPPIDMATAADADLGSACPNDYPSMCPSPAPSWDGGEGHMLG
jgi:hypothetical protein